MKIKTLTTTSLALVATAFVAAQTLLPPTKEVQSKMTPDSVLEDLMKGNERYQAGKLNDPNITARIEATTGGQNPKAIVLSCIDSRVPVEQVFDQGVGDIFVGRVAGNIENGDQLGSMEYATKVAGAKLVIVMGHEGCGAVKGACDDVKLGNITGLLANVKPAIAAVKTKDGEERNSKNKKFVDEVISQNVRQTVADIREKSELLAEMEKKGEIKIVGAVYSLKDGSVSLVK